MGNLDLFLPKTSLAKPEVRVDVPPTCVGCRKSYMDLRPGVCLLDLKEQFLPVPVYHGVVDYYCNSKVTHTSVTS